MADFADVIDLARGPWDIECALQRFVLNPRGFREKLRDVDGIISGGFALQFLARVTWTESDLDVCVCKDQGPELVDYLVKVEGYDCCSVLHGKYNWSEVEEVHALDKFDDSLKNRKQIEVIFTRAEPVKSVLTECYTTALVNIMTYNAAYSLFPIPTFRDHLTFSLKEPDYFHNVLLRKYQDRGYNDIQRMPSSSEDKACGGCFSTKRRRVGDTLTWKVTLPTSNISPPETPSNIESICFEVQDGKLLEQDMEWMVLKPVK